jgi:uroporphyrin-III C-methyltransferase
MAGFTEGVIDRKRTRHGRSGFVSIVGAGPGDPGLLTLRGMRRLREADVVYHDALVSPECLSLCRPTARIVNVGKRRGAHRLSQPMIEALLARDARAGLSVVRLKGGDPYVFGRGGEEALSLRRRGVPFELVPGVTSGTSVPAVAGIPLTHRGLSGSAAFITAHDLSESPAGDATRERLKHLARGADTIVIFMAGAEAARVRETLVHAGLPADTPTAVIESGTQPGERIATGVLRDLERMRSEAASGPVLIVIGKTVSLAQELRPVAAAIEAELSELPASSPHSNETTAGEERGRRRRTG